MAELLVIHGIVLSSMPVGEADRRVVILSGERGRITAFAKGARRPGSMFMASTRPFTYGEFVIYEGRNSNSLDKVDASEYFDDILSDIETSCYGMYFTEFADYYAHEGLEAKEAVRVLYSALLALSKGQMPKSLIKSVYELRMMMINGEYGNLPLHDTSDAVKKAWTYTLTSKLESLFKFLLDEPFLKEFSKEVDYLRDYYVDAKFNSLDILETLK